MIKWPEFQTVPINLIVIGGVMNKQDEEQVQPLDPFAFDATAPERIAIDQIPFDILIQMDEQKAHEESLDRFQASM